MPGSSKFGLLLFAALVLMTFVTGSSSANAAGAAQCADTCNKCREICEVLGVGAGYNCQTITPANSQSGIKSCRCNTVPHILIPACKPGAGGSAPVTPQGIFLGGMCLTAAMMTRFL